MKYQGILFDFDGVLGQTMEDNFEAWKKAVADFGGKIKPEDYYPLEGMKLEKIAEKFRKLLKTREVSVDELVARKEKYYKDNHHFKLYPGVNKTINMFWDKKIPMAIVSAAKHDRLISTVPASFLEKFKVLITGEKNKRGKPYPDPYLKAARELGLNIKNCIVVENAPLGIQSAKRAGAYCIAISSTMDKLFLSEADKIISRFRELPDLKIHNI